MADDDDDDGDGDSAIVMVVTMAGPRLPAGLRWMFDT